MSDRFADAVVRGYGMKVLKGVLSDAEREIIFQSNATGRRVCVHTKHACIEWDQRGPPRCEEDGCYVGVVAGWEHDSFKVGGWSFTTSIPWLSTLAVWWRDEAPEPCPFEVCRSHKLEAE